MKCIRKNCRNEIDEDDPDCILAASQCGDCTRKARRNNREYMKKKKERTGNVNSGSTDQGD